MKPFSRVLLVLTCVFLTACGGVDPNSPEGKRQAIFKQMLHTSEELGGMLRGRVKFDEAAFVQDAAHLSDLSSQPWQHFPKVQEGDRQGDAKDDVWKRQERFQELARKLEAATAALVTATAVQPLDPQILGAPMQKIEGSCEACHREFRAY